MICCPQVFYTRVEFPNIITTLKKTTQAFDGLTPLTSEEMNIQRNSFIMEIQKLLDMHFEDKYVIAEFEDGGTFSCRYFRYFYQVLPNLRMLSTR